MARALGAAVAGWLTGFAIALAWSASHAGTGGSGVGAALVPWALGGLVVIAALLGAVGIREAVARRLAVREERRDREWFERMQGPVERVDTAPPPPPPPVLHIALAPPPVEAAPAPVVADARPATAAADAMAARIALLEARLALEQAELDEAMRRMEEQEQEATGSLVEHILPASIGQAAAEAEPALREELVHALTELVGRRADGTVAAAELSDVLLRRAG